MMKLTGLEIQHKQYGKGVIKLEKGDKITVAFEDCTKIFKYPDAFEKKFLICDDEIVCIEILKDIAEMKAKREEKAQIQKKLEEKRNQVYKYELQEQKKTVKEIKTKENERLNYAFKCNYCDGGKDKTQVGFNGMCSDEIIKYNINKEHRDWCSQPDCWCMQYLNGEITREEIGRWIKRNPNEFNCYESVMLRDWRAGAGWNNNEGPRQNEPRRMKNVVPGKLCILTTRNPDMKENERYIFGAFIIGPCDEGDEYEAGYISAMKGLTIKFSPEEALKLLFWKHYRNTNKPDKKLWGSGLYRLLDDYTAKAFLDDIVEVKQGTEDYLMAVKMRDTFERYRKLNI